MELIAQKREIMGKSVKAVREKGLVPAELYGKGMENIHLSLPLPDFLEVFKEAGSNTVVQLQVGTEVYPVVVHDVQRSFVQDSVEHIDFYKVRLDEKITAKIPLEFTGEALAVKALGAVLNKSMTEVEVEALPNDLPHRLMVNLEMLDAFGKSIYVKDVAVPKGVVVLVEPETVVATVAAPREEKVEVAPVDVAAVKVETEEKKEERAAQKVSEGGDPAK